MLEPDAKRVVHERGQTPAACNLTGLPDMNSLVASPCPSVGNALDADPSGR